MQLFSHPSFHSVVYLNISYTLFDAWYANLRMLTGLKIHL